MGTRLLDDDARAGLIAEVREAVTGTADYIVATGDYARSDRLWPAEMEVFATNPMSVAYGACGPALFLHQDAVPSELPYEAVNWLLEQPLSVDRYPPGLYVGLAGIAWTLQVLGQPERAEEAMAIAYRSPLLYEQPNMLLGAAGWGLASLRLFRETGSESYLRWAERAGDYLLEKAVRTGDTCHWKPEEDEPVPYGFGYGASGVALFLAELHLATGDGGVREAAVRALDFELAHRVESDLGWVWRRFEGDDLDRPYWIQGSAGVGSVVIRLHHHLGIARYLPIAERIARDLFIKFTVNPGLFQGLAGIAEFMLDMHRFTGDDAYLDRAFDMAETILWFKLERAGGVAWPGRWLDRITLDYASGAAGIALFLARLDERGPRLILDFD
jgi:lantibiotic modifying enzyme